MGHDAVRASSLLREIFANDRARIGFLIGAGCPYSIAKPGSDAEKGLPGAKWEGLIPNVAGLTILVLKKLSEDLSGDCGILLAYLKDNGLENENVEVVLSKVRALIDVAGGGTIHGFDIACLKRIEEHICSTIAGVVGADLPESENGYRSLSRWIKGLARDHSVELFTTNYDLLIESALEDDQVTLFDGFTGAKRPFFDVSAIERDNLPSHWAKVWKLHGSINWRASADGKRVCRVTHDNETAGTLIHPSHRKYDQSRRLPYLAVIDRLRNFLKSPSAVLYVTGYSFGDDHINEVLIEGLQNNPTSLVISSLYGNLDQYSSISGIARQASNLTVFADDRAIVGKRTDVWTFDPDQGSGAVRLIFDIVANGENWTGGTMRFKLGNFDSFGRFLDDVSGTFRQVERAARS